MSNSKELLEEFIRLAKEEFKIKKEVSEKENDTKDAISSIADFMSKEKVEEQKDPLVPLNQDFLTRKEFEEHYTLFINRIQQQMSSIGGGGEVFFRWLDDVNRSTMTESNNNWVLEYDSNTNKVQFTNDIGPIDTVWFDPNHDDDHTDEGIVGWNNNDRTLNITHQNGVKQQVGQELYYLVKNVTGSEIPNGTFCRFDGVDLNGINRIDAAPFLADGTYPSLYAIGVATEDIPNGGIGFVTNFGMVRGINTTGTAVGENWQAGQILYASPTNPGKLTNVKPTAPDNVIPVAAVVVSDETDGEIFVRPTFEQRMDYTTISSQTDQTLSVANTPTLITYDTLEFNSGVTFDVLNPSRVVFEQSGLYAVNLNVQIQSTNSSTKNVWIWLRKNGIDVPYSSRVVSITGNAQYEVFHITHNISVDIDDYIEFIFAANDPAITLKSVPATAFAPASPSVHLHIDQVAL